MRRAGAAAVGIGVVLGIAACTSFGEGNDDPVTPPVVTDEGGSDAGVSLVDATPLADAGDGSTASICVDAIWCENFENGLSAWSAPATGMGIDIGPGGGQRGKALHVAGPPGATEHTIERAIPGVTSTARLSLWLYVKPVQYTDEGASSNYAVAALDDTAGTFIGVYLWRGSLDGEATAQLTGASSLKGFQGTPPTALAYDGWHHIEVRVAFGNSGTIEWSLDGAQVASSGFPTLAPVGLKALIGLSRTNETTPAVELFIDDVTAAN